MTEQEWLTCTNPDTLLSNLQGKSERKFLLFAVACCHRIWPLMADTHCRRLVEVVERRVEQQTTEDEWREASLLARQAWSESSAQYAEVYTRRLAGEPPLEQDTIIYARHFAATAAWELRHYPSTTPHIRTTPGWEGYGAAVQVARWTATATHDAFLKNPEEARIRQFPVPCSQAADFDHHNSPERPRQCDLLRCIFGPPHFRPEALDPAWMSSTVKRLAEAIYETRDFSRLPILADALEEAGCADAEILTHCRQQGPHVRGCWVVDLVLGRA